jgi:hypothetical protein
VSATATFARLGSSNEERVLEEPELSREVNRRIHAIAAGWEDAVEVDYVCECDAYECRAWVRVSRAGFQHVLDQPGTYLLAKEHHRRGAETIRSGLGYSVVRVSQAAC